MKKQLKLQLLAIALISIIATIAVGCDRLLKKPFQLPPSAKQEPWAVQIGLRVGLIRDNIPTVNRIVLVPDEATFLAAIQKWNFKGHWPILIEDQKYAPMFLQRFQPEEIVRLPSIKQEIPKGQKLQQLMLKATAAAWNATDTQTLKAKWRELGWEPPGVVITSENDPARLAAVALAAARGQPLVFVEGNFGKPNDNLNTAQWKTLQTAVTKAVESTGYFYSQLGDAIDTITIVRQLAVKYQSPQKQDEQWAVTDGLGRHPNGERWAAAGWIYGSQVRSIYQAMCAIFLDSETAMLYDSYPKEGNWGKYEMESVASGLKSIGLNVELVQKPESTLQLWRSLASKPWTFDLILMNSKGYPKSFQVGNGDALVEDIPKLKFPAAIHMIHSWSASDPDDANTVAGRWLQNGAYAYVGSVNEPLLSAFIPPKIMVDRLKRGAPFLIAARQLESPPWKVATIGDPLMSIAKPKPRIPVAQQPI
ncbi:MULTISPECIES: hypothetical protein [unclassified Microcoleus]|uniref:hypothetical protein n=1 Tax=unclassified Microcoleus TaxID=2642155 RepID=UPI001D44C27A|nr:MULTISPECIES: hypothetical protein [unclassified Microcoleus]MCC3505848.1 hypothetical protein [Microcoleus sp. PH2017_19_SFW_U_A]MCC3524643.1 hypothetical protein [Microcoleus sp. PH2017_20_SFW_D_A]MCC3556749.1 hypothetical protein [Microcoleus sp. PH2017_35_SFW_U_B]TAG94419.1 MAG: hypothetical protein EAZ19_13940 [Oscillatoriales cyanobacterium]